MINKSLKEILLPCFTFLIHKVIILILPVLKQNGLKKLLLSNKWYDLKKIIISFHFFDSFINFFFMIISFIIINIFIYLFIYYFFLFVIIFFKIYRKQF